MRYRQHPAPVSVPRRGQADFAPPGVGRATRREARMPSKESPPSKRRLRRICDAESSRVRVAVCMEVAPGPARPREAAARRGGAAAPDHARARCASRAPALQPAEGDDARRGGRHSHAQRPTALVRDGLRAPRAAARIAARPSRPGSRSRMSTDIGCWARSRSAAGKSARRRLSPSILGWEWRRRPSAARAWPPGRLRSPWWRCRAPQRSGRGAQTAEIAAG